MCFFQTYVQVLLRVLYNMKTINKELNNNNKEKKHLQKKMPYNEKWTEKMDKKIPSTSDEKKMEMVIFSSYLVAKSLCTKFICSKYFIPEAICVAMYIKQP